MHAIRVVGHSHLVNRTAGEHLGAGRRLQAPQAQGRVGPGDRSAKGGETPAIRIDEPVALRELLADIRDLQYVLAGNWISQDGFPVKSNCQ